MGARRAGVRELAVAALPADVPADAAGGAAGRPGQDGAGAGPLEALPARRSRPRRSTASNSRKAVAAGAEPRLLAGLAAGLGECGDAADAAELARLLADPRAGVRRAAARGVRRLARPSELVPLLGPLANDPDPGVAREVFEGLARVPHEVPPETLWIGRTRTEPAVRRLAERISARVRQPRMPSASGCGAALRPAVRARRTGLTCGHAEPCGSLGVRAGRGYAQSGHRPR